MTAADRLSAARRAAGVLAAPPMPDEGTKERVRAGLREPYPRLHDATPEAMGRWYRAFWSAFPDWGFDAVYVGEVARDFLPRVLADMGVGPMIGRVHHDPMVALIAGATLPQLLATRPVVDWRDVLAALPPQMVPLGGDPEHAPGLVFDLHAAPSPALFLCEASHEWRCPALARSGACLVDLGAWRWNISAAKAAHRIARLCGLRRPVP